MFYLTSVTPGAGPSTTTDPSPQNWSPENDQLVKNDINKAMNYAHGNIEQAFTYLRDKRDQPSNYYDTNLALAADYLRARWDTQRHGPEAETQAINTYMAAKRLGLAPKEGPGPISPYSDKERSLMLKGVQDEAQQMPLLERLAWDLPNPFFPGTTVGQVKAVIDNIPHLG
ncbi:MAG TPA: hypothetical protein VH351_15060 [Bryobacteraceae bacterium]|jgi:hypothetical protein|nr:hypothetical protein [Bryobacteraceae bacterium]